MTLAADRALLADWTAGRIKTREEHLIRHVGTIDSEAELDGFADELTASGGMTDDIRIAAMRRQKQIGETK